MNLEQAKGLLQKYRMGLCSEEEVRAIENWYESLEEKSDWSWNEAEKQAFNQSLIDAIHRSKAALDTDIAVVPIHKRLWLRLAVAASILFLVGMGTYEWFVHRSVKSAGPSIAQVHDVAPGSNKAILTLADGRRVDLDSISNGIISQQGSSRAIKSLPGQLSYLATGGLHAPVVSAVLYNTLVTPRAGQYSLVLPDGTRVWLNSASKLRYPTSFTGKNRQVELTGEAYFEVAANPGRPFKVSIGSPVSSGGIVQVLGTHFNIMAYEDENVVKTTLLEGSVRFLQGGQQVLVKPGEQVQSQKDGGLKVINDPDAKGEISWKNGYFHFSGADIQTVLRQLSRWYDIEVTYKGAIPDPQFVGEIQRNQPLSLVLEMLEKNQVAHFEVNNRLITVRPW